jgi:hypothetical protein
MLACAGALPLACALSFASLPVETSTAATSTQSPALKVHAPVERDLVAGGRHIRVETSRGAVHVWRPPGYDADRAGILVYVHGYYTDVDRAFEEHHLAEQFAKSRQNALFIACEAPDGKKQDVFWKDLGELLDTVRTKTGLRTPDGPLVILGHSGAYRTLAEWLAYRRIDEMILLDALYANEEDFRAWIESMPRHGSRKLVIVSIETTKRSDAFVDKQRFAAKAEKVPDRLFELTRGKRNAQVVYLKSQYDHMALVTGDKAIPLLLRLTPFDRL